VAEPDERPRDGDVERYESLRHHALAGEASGWRLGLAVLQRQGMAAWLRAGSALPPSPPSTATSGFGIGDELVGVLATMAIACISGG
jgi:hypothetical protein